MTLIEQVFELAKGPLKAFCWKFPSPFLLRQPTARQKSLSEAPPMAMEFHTKIAKWESDGLLPGQWWLAEVSKRLGNPYPDRITVGRAANCDVALRFPYMSKLHSRFLLDGGRIAKLEDCGSSNGTFRNGVRLAEGQPVVVTMGDRLTFGNLEVEFVDAKTLYERAQKGPR